MKLETLRCPYCEKDKKSKTKGEFNSFRTWSKTFNEEEAIWQKDGRYIEIPFQCGIDPRHNWELIIGEHQEKTYIFKRLM